MKYFLLSFIAAAVLAFNIYPQSKPVKPVNVSQKTIINVSGNARDYFLLDPFKENILQISGPGKLKIITRIRFNSEKQKQQNYSVFYRIDGTDKHETKIQNIKVSKNSKYKKKELGIPGEEHSFIITLHEGEHTIQIWGQNAKAKIDARFLFIPGKEKKVKWVALTPLAPNEQVNLISNEEEVSYFRFSESKPLKVKIIGPTKLRILSRVENHYNMKGRIFYRLKVNEDGKLKNSFQLNSVRSESAVYEKDPKKVPGKATEIVIDVPEGSHTYDIIPLDKDKNTVLGKVLFPKKDMKLGEK